MMQLGELLLADIAVAQFRRMHRLRRGGGILTVGGVMQAGGVRREIVRGAEHRLAAQGPDAGLLQQRLGLGHLLLVARLGLLLQFRPAGLGFRVVDLGHHLVQADAVSLRQRIEHAAVGFDGLQQVQRGAQAVGQGQVVVGKGQGGGIQFKSGKAAG